MLSRSALCLILSFTCLLALSRPAFADELLDPDDSLEPSALEGNGTGWSDILNALLRPGTINARDLEIAKYLAKAYYESSDCNIAHAPIPCQGCDTWRDYNSWYYYWVSSARTPLLYVWASSRGSQRTTYRSNSALCSTYFHEWYDYYNLGYSSDNSSTINAIYSIVSSDLNLDQNIRQVLLSMANDINYIESAVNSINSSLSDVASKIDITNQRLGDPSTNGGSVTAQLKTIRAQITTLNASLTTLNNTVNSINVNVSTIKSKVVTMLEAVGDAQNGGTIIVQLRRLRETLTTISSLIVNNNNYSGPSIISYLKQISDAMGPDPDHPNNNVVSNLIAIRRLIVNNLNYGGQSMLQTFLNIETSLGKVEKALVRDDTSNNNVVSNLIAIRKLIVNNLSYSGPSLIVILTDLYNRVDFIARRIVNNANYNGDSIIQILMDIRDALQAGGGGTVNIDSQGLSYLATCANKLTAISDKLVRNNNYTGKSIIGYLADIYEKQEQILNAIPTDIVIPAEDYTDLLTALELVNTRLLNLYDKMDDLVTYVSSGFQAVDDDIDLLHTDLVAVLQAISDIPSGDVSIDIEPDSTPTEQLTVDFAKLKSKFPFSIPWDLLAILKLFQAAPLTPTFDITLSYPGISSLELQYDLHDFDGVASVSRTCSLIMFTCGLLFNTKKFLSLDGE